MSDIKTIHVSVTKSHPSGQYGRAGMRFCREPTVIDVATLNEETINLLNDDPWLDVYLTAAEAPPVDDEPPADDKAPVDDEQPLGEAPPAKVEETAPAKKTKAK